MKLFQVLFGGGGSRALSRDVRLLILGLDNAGKTTILRSLSNEAIQNVQPTRGFNVKSLRHGNFKLDVWDIGGHSAIRPYWRNYYSGVDGLIYVVDSTDDTRLIETGAEFGEILTDPKLTDVPVLVFANKQDLPSALPASQVAEALQLHLVRDHMWQIEGCSAKTGARLKEGLEWLLQNLKRT
ncbi:ARF/SAR superfamily [Pelomyxa schiedti]|nr:ARF/SAR superfamily [Pelomyxa schiedti]